MLRRSHKKSKHGCVDCKRRHIKCDESRPECVNCTTAHISCSYVGSQRSPQGNNIRFITSEEQSRSASIASNTPPTASDHHPPPSSSQAYVNILHLELFHNFIANTSRHLGANEIAGEMTPKFIKYALSSPFLMYEALSLSALHLSTSHPERAQSFRDESAKLQTEALRMFNDSVKEINAENVIPAFIYSGLLGLHYFSDTFATPSESLDDFLDRLVQSLRLLRGVRAILTGWWEFLLNSDIKTMIQEGQAVSDRSDEVVQHLDELCGSITQSAGLDPSQSKVCEDAIRQMIWVYKSQPSSDLMGEKQNPWMITTWPIMVSPEYMNLLAQRKPEALVVLSYFTVLLHNCSGFWAIGKGGRFLLDVLGAYLGEQWKAWLAWPRSIIYVSS